MSRRANERDLERAEANPRRHRRNEAGAKARLLAKLQTMADAHDAQAERLRADGIEPVELTDDDHLAWSMRWEADQLDRVRLTQQRLIDRATGELGYGSDEPDHRAAQDNADLRNVESAKVLLRMAINARRIFSERTATT